MYTFSSKIKKIISKHLELFLKFKMNNFFPLYFTSHPENIRGKFVMALKLKDLNSFLETTFIWARYLLAKALFIQKHFPPDSCLNMFCS